MKVDWQRLLVSALAYVCTSTVASILPTQVPAPVNAPPRYLTKQEQAHHAAHNPSRFGVLLGSDALGAAAELIPSGEALVVVQSLGTRVPATTTPALKTKPNPGRP